MKRPTIRDVAQVAGVSVGTVSNVLNDAAGVTERTRALVAEAVDRLGYRPNTLARSLIARRGRGGLPHPPPGAPRLLVAGYMSVDYTARLDVLPHRDDRVTATGIEKSLGGPAANVAVMAARLGPPFCVHSALFTTIGDDADSDWALEILTERGVDTEGISRQSGGRLSRCIVLVESNGARTIVNEPMPLRPDDLSAFLAGEEKRADRLCLHLDGYQVALFERDVASAAAAGVITSVHTTGLPQAWRSVAGLARLRELFGLVFLNRDVGRDVFGANLSERALQDSVAAFAAETASDALAPGLLLLTMGESGAVCLGPDGTVAAPTPQVAVVNTIGAGDTFAGIFLAGWLNDMPASDALAMAVEAASLSVAVDGAQDLVLTPDDLAPFRARYGERLTP